MIKHALVSFMNYKIFIKVFFEKTKYLILYSLCIITFWYAMFINVVDDTYLVHYEKNMPDIEIYGETTDSINSFLLYKDLEPSIQNKLTEEGISSYSLTVRNLYSFSDAYYQVSYRIYGAEESFIQELSDYLRRGKLPEPGKAEAVIGSNVAKLLDLEVGDVIPVPVTLEEQIEDASLEYVVSGITKTDASFYCDGIYISRDTYEMLEHKVGTNTIYVYATKSVCQNLIAQLEGKEVKGIGGLTPYFKSKVSLDRTIRIALIRTIPFSAVVLVILFLSLMKYTGRKIGLMKALGISDRHIMRLLMKGFGIYNLVGLLLSYVSLGFIRLTLGVSLPLSVILYSVGSFAIIFLVTIVILFVFCKNISPRLAMYPY